MKIQKRNRRSVAPLPDDLVMEILSRMPALDVLKCRRVCRGWRDLISTQHFREMHLKAKAYHSSMILVDKFEPIENKGALLLLDKWEKPRKRPTIRRSRPNFIDNPGFTDVQLSYDGFIVMKSRERVFGFTIFNPISRDSVRIETPMPGFHAFAMFFNPLIKEYCILLGKYRSAFDVEFQMVNLGAQPCCRALKQPVSLLHKPRNPYCEHPVVIDDDATIFWLVEEWTHHSSYCKELIMSFNIMTEKFTFMPHPDLIDDCQSFGHENMHIIKTGGRLSLAQTKSALELTINIWTLKDSAARLWTKTHSVSIDLNIYIDEFIGLMVMAVGRGELLLHYSGYDYEDENEIVFAYDLELGTLRKIGKTYQNSQISIFVPSLVSLRNCEPIIRI